MNKEIKKILLVLAFASLSSGMMYGFQKLWMQENNLTVATIGTVFSICSLLSVSVIFLCSNIINQTKLKKFELGIMVIKLVCITSLFFLNNSGHNILIKFLIMIDYILDVEIYTCIYPMLTLINKNDKLYARKDLIYKFLYYFAFLIAGFILGKKIFNIKINYNFFVFASALSLLIAIIILIKTNLEQYYGKIKSKKDKQLLIELVSKLKGDKISIFYLIAHITGLISYYSILGLLAIIFINYFNFSTSSYSLFNTLMGILAVIIGSIILEKLTFKNDYLNVFVKFGGRVVIYLLAFIINNKVVYLLAFIYTLFFAESYVHIIDAPYINRYEGKYQLAFCNLKEMCGYLGRSIGVYLCGLLFTINIRMNFAVAFIFCLINLVFRYLDINLRKKEENDRK